jgi:iron complex outermembrane receptor protein
VARNYHLPTLNDLYWQPGGNPELRPEQGFSMEAGLEYLKLFRGVRLPGSRKLQAEITMYRSYIDQWILWIPSYRGYWEPVNIRDVLSTGTETELGWEAGRGAFHYSLRGTYAYTHSVNLGDSLVWSDASYGKQLVYVPLHSGNLMVRVSYRAFFLTYQYNAYSERFTTSSNDLTRRDWLYPYFMNDVAVGAMFRAGKVLLSAELKVMNLFNETYHSVLYRPMPGRNYHLLIQMKL